MFVFSLYCSSWDLLCTEPKSFSDQRDLFWSKDVAVCHRYLSHQGVLSAFNITVAPPSNHHTVCNWACLIKKRNPLLFFYTVNCLWSDAFVFMEWKSTEFEASTSLCCWLSQPVLKRSRVPVLPDTAALIADNIVFWGGLEVQYLLWPSFSSPCSNSWQRLSLNILNLLVLNHLTFQNYCLICHYRLVWKQVATSFFNNRRLFVIKAL